jgi:mannose-1-phosphate guanylyltransferase
LGRPFLEHMLVYLRNQGMSEIALALGHAPEPIRDYFGDGDRWGVELTIAVESQPLGSGGAIKQFQDSMQESFFAFNGDIFTNLNLAAMAGLHRETGAAVTIALIDVPDPSAFGVVALDGDGRIRRFVEKPPPAQAPSHWANAGAWLFEPSVLQHIPDGRKTMVETELFPQLIAAGEHVQGYREQCFWVDIGTPERYLQTQLLLLERPELRLLPLGTWPSTDHLRTEPSGAGAPAPTIAASARVRGPVLLGAGVRIEDGAEVVGPAVLDTGCIVGPNAHVGRSVLWPHCQVGGHVSIRDSVLGASVIVGDAARLENVVVAGGVSIAAAMQLSGAHLAPAGLA